MPRLAPVPRVASRKHGGPSIRPPVGVSTRNVRVAPARVLWTHLPSHGRRTMTRTPGRWNLALAASILATLMLATTAASAQTAVPTPVIDSHPAKVKFGRTAVIEGHLENGLPGDEVTLQRRRGANDWWDVSTKPVDDDLRVVFSRRDMRRTTNYRLAYSDEVEQVETQSDPVRVKVAPRLTLKVSPDDTFIGRRVTMSGRLLPVRSGRYVRLKQKVRGEWRLIKKVPVKDGRFSGSFEVHRKGFRKVRAVFRGDGLSTRKRKTKDLTIYRPDKATWYGPGFYGNTTACGKTLRSGTLGVAHRNLPCGSKVSILYGGRTITVSVIDRGPYTDANWDLTEETAERIGFSGSGTIGVTR